MTDRRAMQIATPRTECLGSSPPMFQLTDMDVRTLHGEPSMKDRANLERRDSGPRPIAKLTDPCGNFADAMMITRHGGHGWQIALDRIESKSIFWNIRFVLFHALASEDAQQACAFLNAPVTNLLVSGARREPFPRSRHALHEHGRPRTALAKSVEALGFCHCSVLTIDFRIEIIGILEQLLHQSIRFLKGVDRIAQRIDFLAVRCVKLQMGLTDFPIDGAQTIFVHDMVPFQQLVLAMWAQAGRRGLKEDPDGHEHTH